MTSVVQAVSGPAITDVAGEGATPLQLERLCNRYYWAAPFCRDRSVLEVACGTGQGLGYLARGATSVAGGDLSNENLAVARSTYGRRVPLLRLDALALPVRDHSLDVVLLLETIYFLVDADAFVREARRVLKPGGYLLLSAINKDCADYNPHNEHYRRHYGARELARVASAGGFQVECFGALPMNQAPGRTRWLGPIKRIAAKLRLIPEGMQAKLWLKRVMYGPLVPLPREITERSAPYRPPEPIPSDRPDTRHQVVLCAAKAPA
jgi:SAM-dependent methyltransferase